MNQDCYHETRERLQAVVDESGLSRYKWAITNGICTGTVYDVLNSRPVSVKRLNIVRALLGLTAVGVEVVTIDPTRQKIVNRQGPASYISRQVRLAVGEAGIVDDLIKNVYGYKSFSEWFRAEILDGLLETYSVAVEGVLE